MSKLEQLGDLLREVKRENQNLQKQNAESRQLSDKLRTQHDSELESAKADHEADVHDLKDKLDELDRRSQQAIAHLKEANRKAEEAARASLEAERDARAQEVRKLQDDAEAEIARIKDRAKADMETARQDSQEELQRVRHDLE